MPSRTSCPRCHAEYVVRPEHAGKALRCKKCQALFTVPPPAAGARVQDRPAPRGSADDTGDGAAAAAGPVDWWAGSGDSVAAQPPRVTRVAADREPPPERPVARGFSGAVLAAAVAGALALGGASGSAVTYLLTRPSSQPPAVAAQEAARPFEGPGRGAEDTGTPVHPQEPAPRPATQPTAVTPVATSPAQPDAAPGPQEAPRIKAVAGRPLRYQLPVRPGQDRLELVSAPPGVELDAAGRLRWTPTTDQVGTHELAVRVTDDGGSAVRRYPLEVMAPRTRVVSRSGATDPAPAALRPGTTLPVKATSGRLFTYQLPRTEGQTFALLHGPDGVTVSTDGKLAWTPGPGPGRTESVSVRVQPGHVLSFRIAVEEDAGSTVALPNPGGWVMLRDGVRLIVALPAEAKLAYIDTVAHKELRRVELPFKPGALAYQGDRLFAAVEGAARLYILDLDTGAVRKQVKVPDGPIADMTCHPENGLVYATTATRRIVAIDPDAGTARATRARGMFVAIDPVKGDTLYSGIQPDIQDVLLIKELSKGRFTLEAGVRGDRALLARMQVSGGGLRVVGVNANAAVNGCVVRVSADGKSVTVVGRGGYRAAPGGTGGSFPAYGVGLFDADDITSLGGVVEVGAYPQDLAFHPVLDLAVAEQEGIITRGPGTAAPGKALHLFHSKSLAAVRTITVGSAGPPAPPSRDMRRAGRILTFGGRGTKLLYYDQGSLRAIPLELSDKDRLALARAYGK
jgi:predicted Zn finger-like uncharacterized protein